MARSTLPLVTRKVTAEVDAGAYPARHRGAALTHLVDLEDGSVVRVACSRVRVDSIAEDGCSYTEERPTCPVCAKAWDKLH